MAVSSNPQVAPLSLVVSSDDLPWADDFGGAEGLRLKVMLADIEAGVFVVRILFPPGIQLPTHHHTGAVHAFTLAGEWSYLEYEDAPPSRAGSYLYEPPGSIHTLKVADTNTGETDAIFVVHGAMVIYDDAGTIIGMIDAATHRRDYVVALREQGKPVPRFIEGGQAKYTDD